MRLESYGDHDISALFVRKLLYKIENIPNNFKSIKKHVEICVLLSKVIAHNLLKYRYINQELVIWSHYLRSIFRHKLEENYFLCQNSDVRLSAKYAKEFNENELSEIVIKYRSCYDESILNSLKIEDVVFLLTGALVYGEKLDDFNYKHYILTLDQRKTIVMLNNKTRNKSDVINEYDKVLIPLGRALEQCIDFKSCCDEIKNKLSIPHYKYTKITAVP